MCTKSHGMDQRQTKAFKQASPNHLPLRPGPLGTDGIATSIWRVDSYARRGSKILRTSAENAALHDVSAKLDATTMQQNAKHIANSAE